MLTSLADEALRHDEKNFISHHLTLRHQVVVSFGSNNSAYLLLQSNAFSNSTHNDNDTCVCVCVLERVQSSIAITNNKRTFSSQ